MLLQIIELYSLDNCVEVVDGFVMQQSYGCNGVYCTTMSGVHVEHEKAKTLATCDIMQSQLLPPF